MTLTCHFCQAAAGSSTSALLNISTELRNLVTVLEALPESSTVTEPEVVAKKRNLAVFAELLRCKPDLVKAPSVLEAVHKRSCEAQVTASMISVDPPLQIMIGGYWRHYRRQVMIVAGLQVHLFIHACIFFTLLLGLQHSLHV
jgi:hypothetical protein